MAKNFDLTSPQWLEMVFKGKNREYGAYVMRRNSSDRHIWAMGITVLLVTGMMFLPGLFKSEASTSSGEDWCRDGVVMLDNSLNQQEEQERPVDPIATPPPPPMKATIQFTPPVIDRDENVRTEDQMITQQALTDTKLDISIVTNLEGVKDGVDPADLIEHDRIVQVEKPKAVVLTRAQQMPQFPGGDAALYKWLSNNLVYPSIAAERGTQGTVTLRFVVTESGDIGEIQILKGSEQELDKEALRVVRQLPKFIPGRQNGQAVPVWFTLPVKFKLQ